MPEDGGSGAGQLRAAGGSTREGYERGCAFNFLLIPDRDDQVSWGTLERRFRGCSAARHRGRSAPPGPSPAPREIVGREAQVTRVLGAGSAPSSGKAFPAPRTGESSPHARPAGRTPPRGRRSLRRSPARGEGRVEAGPRSPLGASTRSGLGSARPPGRTDEFRPAPAPTPAPAPWSSGGGRGSRPAPSPARHLRGGGQLRWGNSTCRDLTLLWR